MKLNLKKGKNASAFKAFLNFTLVPQYREQHILFTFIL